MLMLRMAKRLQIRGSASWGLLVCKVLQLADENLQRWRAALLPLHLHVLPLLSGSDWCFPVSRPHQHMAALQHCQRARERDVGTNSRGRAARDTNDKPHMRGQLLDVIAEYIEIYTSRR